MSSVIHGFNVAIIPVIQVLLLLIRCLVILAPRQRQCKQGEEG